MTTSLHEPDDDRGRPSTTAADRPRDNPSTAPATPPSTSVVEEFTTFYREAAPRLVAFLRWHGAPLSDAADCAQEALTQAFRQWTTLDHPYAWCRLVASRRYARHVATIREHPTGDLDHAPGTPLLPPDTDLEELEHRHTILALLDQLPLRQRQVMAWTYDGATPTEIATALKITPAAARSNLHKARTTLRTAATSLTPEIAGEDR